MKIAAALCLSLALFSPAYALRGNRRRVEEEESIVRVKDETTAPTPSPTKKAGSSGSTTSDHTTDSKADSSGQTTPTTTTTTGVDVVTTTGVDVVTSPTGAPIFEIDKFALYSSEARKGKSGKDSNDKDDSDESLDIEPDSLCADFCVRYMATCEGANAFFNPDMPRGTTAGRRRLISGAMLDIPRLSGSVFDSYDDCLKACVGYPRPTNPADYLQPKSLGINSIGDTFWCRNQHLKIAERTKKEHFGAQTHCPFASPSGGGVCANVVVDTSTGFNATAYEFERAGASSSRHIGFCQMYFNDLVADCTSAGIDDVNFDLVLALIPVETEVIILNNNVGKRDPVTGNTLGSGITVIKDEQFRGLLCPSCIKALIIDDGNIETLNELSFTALPFLQSLSLNMQKISFIPTGLLQNNPDLREFSMYNTRDKVGMLEDGSIPSNLFTQRATKIARIVISGHKGLTSLPTGLFSGLTKLAILILSNNGFTNDGVPETSFDGLGGLQIWDMSGNQFIKAPAAWLSSGWANQLTNFYLYMNPLEELEAGIFDTFSEGFCHLEVVLLHDTDLKTVNVGTFDICQDSLISYTLSNRV